MDGDEHFWQCAGFALLGGIAAIVLLFVLAWSIRVPTDAEAASIAGDRRLIAYQTEAGQQPSLLMIQDNRLLFAPLDLDLTDLLALSPPAWEADELLPVGSVTDDPASAFVCGCVEANLTCPEKVYVGGQVNDPRIAEVQIQVNRQWISFLASAPGFLKTIGAGDVIGDIRWRDASGRVIWAIDRNRDGAIGSGGCLRKTLQMLDRPGEAVSLRECLHDQTA
jgi:hypothetical protein